MTHPEPPPIPPIETAEDPIHSPADLQERWRALMGPLGFGERLLWLGFIGPDHRFVKMLSRVPLRPRPQARVLHELMSAVHRLLDRDDLTGSRVALLLTGPGRGGVSPADRIWSARLVEAAARFDIPLEPIFAANDEVLLPVDAA
ncbi:hypothetical protein [Mycolicibacter acidiphilus]|nr:hypothetical protein [Mycolicibacter acidiphilus]